MIKQILFCILFLSTVRLTAQSYNYATHGNMESSGEMKQINAKNFYLIKNVSGCCNEGLKIVGRSSSNNILFNVNVTTDPYVDQFGIAVTSDKKIVSFAGTRWKGCDYGGPRFRIIKVDTNGTVEYSQTLSKIITSMAPGKNGEMIYFANDSLFRYSASNQLLEQKFIGIHPNAALVLTDGAMVLSYTANVSQSSQFRLRKTDSVGNQKIDVPVNGHVRNLTEMSDGNYLGTLQGHVSRFSSNLVPTGSSSLILAPGNQITAFCVNSDSIYAVGTGPGFEPKYFIFDTIFNLLFQSSGNLKHVFPTGISVTPENKLRLISYCGGSAFYFSGYFELDKYSNWNGTKDLGITRMIQVTHTLQPFQGTLYMPVLAAQVMVKNFGSDTVKYFKLNSYAYMGGISSCYFGLHEEFAVTVLPGDSASVQTSTFYGQYFSSNGLGPGGTYSLNLCIYSSVPNHLNDYDVSNNGACKIIPFQVVGLAESEMEKDVILFPNPAENILTISSDAGLQKVEVSDLTGKVIYSTDLRSNTFQFDSSLLENGIYLFKIFSDGNAVVRKIVVNH